MRGVTRSAGDVPGVQVAFRWQVHDGGMDDIAEARPTRPARKLQAAGLVGAGLVAGLVMAGLTTASAQTDPAPPPGASSTPTHEGKHPEGHRGGRHGGHVMKGLARGALHGEFTTRAPGGGFQTMAMQHGEATAVSATSITVRSEDGFSRTYVIDDGTLVKAGDEGSADIAAGDTVHVLAVVEDGSATAVRVVDATAVKKLRDRWRPGQARPSAAPSGAAS